MSDFPKSKNSQLIKILTFILLCLILSTILIPLAACDPVENEAKERPAAYGEAGKKFAEKLVQKFPRRVPGSQQEKGASEMIYEQLKEFGYSPQVQSFAFYLDGKKVESQNVYTKLSGKGFVYSPIFKRDYDENAAERQDDKILIIGAHYDTPDFMPLSELGYNRRNTANGIHNNASGVAAVMMAAKQMLEQRPGYDIHFVFFGAGTNKQEGAIAYLDSLSEQEIANIDAMVNIGPIYAGEKIYAHAGQNSVVGNKEKDYKMRRKLYQVTDIFFDYQLNTNNNYAVYTNQTSFYMPYTAAKGGTSGNGLYREWTTKISDHTPFDRMGIPIVFIESGEYDVERKEDLGIENKSPRFSSTNGRISGTLFDEKRLLEKFFLTMEEEANKTLPTLDTEESKTETTAESKTLTETSKPEKTIRIDRLTQRINNTAFILVELARRGPLNYEFDS